MRDSVGKILVAVDSSEGSELAARAAADLSSRLGAELHVAHVWQDIRSARLQSFVRRELERVGREVLDERVREIESGGTEVAEAHLRMGRASDTVLALAGEISADLIVVGSREMGQTKRLILGSVSEGILNGSTEPVLVVRGGLWPPKRLVIGDDGSAAANQAGELALEIAGVLGLDALLVRAYQEPPVPPRGWSPEEASELDAVRLAEEEAASRRAEELGALAGGPEPRASFVVEDPAKAILDAAGEDEGTLIALGSRGLGTVRRMMLGSVSQKVLRSAYGPVLVCSGPPDSSGADPQAAPGD